jgi:hypothetical protein
MRDILRTPRREWESERKLVAEKGWGTRLLGKQNPDGNWGRAPYQPKWTSTTYTMQLLRRIGLEPGHPAALRACRLYIEQGTSPDGGINFWYPRRQISETCVTGMILSQLTYFKSGDDYTEEIIKYILREQMPDGGWNCERPNGAKHSSFHTTISVLEGLREYALNGGPQTSKVLKAEAQGREFFLEHRLFKSSSTGEIFDPKMTRFYFPPRWHHDILRALDYFQSAQAPWDERLSDAFEILLRRRGKDGWWIIPRGYSGVVFFEMEPHGKPSRWNTLRALRVLSWHRDRP